MEKKYVTFSVKQSIFLAWVLSLGAVLMLGQTVSAEESIIEESLVTETAPVVDVQEDSTTDGAFIFLSQVEQESVIEEVSTSSVVEVVDEVVDENVVAEAAEIITLVPELESEKDDYHPGETATIFGRFFSPLKTFMVKVFGSDENEQNYTETESEVISDEAGAFSFDYVLDSLYRPYYEVIVSTLAGEKVAETWFRDSSIAIYDQCANDDGDGYNGDPGDCNWINGNMQANAATYYEGESTVQRLAINGYAPNSTHFVTFKYGTTKAGKHAYDYLTNWDSSEDWITEADRCLGITGCTSAVDTYGPMQDDALVPLSIEPSPASRSFTMRGGEILSVSAPVVVSGSYASDSETEVTVTFKTAATSSPMCQTSIVGTGAKAESVTSCGIAIWFGAHIALGSEWTKENGTTGAGTINGSPYHVALSKEDGASVGQRDNQMQSAAILPPEPTGVITIIKNSVPDDGQDFAFTATGAGLSNFSLDDDGDNTLSNTKTFSGLVDGSYAVTELAAAGFDLTALSCVDPSLGTVVNGAVANINLVGGETVTCTYTNTKRGSITIIKNTIGGDGTFNFTGNTGVTQLVTANGTAAQTVVSVIPGAYSIAETVPAGWSLTSAACDQGEAIDSIDIGPGEHVTCTFTNSKDATLKLVKVVTNNNGGNATADDFQAKIDGNNVAWGVAVPVVPGAHTASETTLATYAASGWGGACAADGSVSLAPGENKICTITNDDIAPKLHLRKVVINDNGGGASTTSFTLTADGAALNDISGTSPVDSGSGLMADTFALGETSVSGYAASDWVCTGDGTQNGASITLGLNEEATCTITNNDVAPQLTVIKHVINDDGGLKTAADFTMNVVATNASDDSFVGSETGTTITLDVGAYFVDETDLPDYAKSLGSNCSGTIAIGETKVCTITNDDKLGSLIVHKVTNPASDTTTPFTITAAKDGVGAVVGVAEQTIAGGETETYVVEAGVYDVTEATLAGWTETSNTCSNVSVANGATEHCTITNTKKGHLIVQKTTLPALDQTSFAITASGDGVITGGGAGSVTDALDRDYEVTPGTYSVSETVPAGWDKTGNTCEDIVIGAGETKTCTITNTKRGHIVIEKNAVPDSNTQEFSFTNNFGNGNPTTFALTDTTAAGLPNYNAEVIPGKYVVSEEGVAGWQLDSVTCSSGETVTDLDVEPGETVTCTYTNEKLAKLTLVKNTFGGNGTFDFVFTGAGLPTNDSITTVANTGSEVYENLNPDLEFSIDETPVPAGWEKQSATCSNGDLVTEITPNAGEEITCTFTNAKLPTLTLVKAVENNYGGTKVALDFQGKINGINQTWEVANILQPGTHTASETQMFGYEASDWGEDCSALGSVTLAYGEDKTCTITNSDIAPKLKVIKHVINDDGGNDVAADFVMNVIAKNPSDDSFAGSETGTIVTLEAGEYSVDENNYPGYTKSLGENCSGTIAIGETKVCTITNDDKPASVTLTKVVVNDHGGTAKPDDFGLTIGGEVATSGETYEVDSNTEHALNEVGLLGYDFVSLTGDAKCPAVLGGTVELGEGEQVSCTITNNDKPGRLEIIKNTIGGNGTFDFEVGGPSASTPSVTTVAGTGTTGVFEVSAGSYGVAEEAKVGWDLSSSTCSTGTPAEFSVVNGGLVTCTFTNTSRATVTIVKDAQPSDTQDFLFTSRALGNFTLDDDAGVTDPAEGEALGEWSNSKTIQNVVPGEVRVSETQPNQYWKLKSATCVETGTQNIVASTLIGTELVLQTVPGANITCTFVNEKISPTRTQGFWQTHTDFTASAFATYFANGMKIGNNETKIDNAAKLFGAWYSSIPKKTDNMQRTALDKARMILLQQLVTAKLNCAKFGCVDSVKVMIIAADTAYAGNSASAIMAAAGQLDAYNNSGDTIVVENTGKATPKASQSLANKSFWNTLP